MKKLLLLSCCIFMCGCESAPVSQSVPVDPVMQRRFISVSQLRPGLTRSEVAGLLGKEVVTGYSLTDEASGEYAPITVPNPQRAETIQKDKKAYSVDYYLVGVKVADDKVSDDEVVPVIYLNDRIVGVGWDFLNQRVKGSH